VVGTATVWVALVWVSVIEGDDDWCAASLEDFVTDGVLIAPLALIRLIDSSRAEARWISMSRITTCPAGSGARNGRRK